MEKYKEILKNKGLSVTQARCEILRALDEMHDPVTIEELQKTIELSINTSTLYRSLKVLVDRGVVYQTDFRDGAAYFEYQQEHHHHLVCTSCKSHTAIHVCVDSLFPGIEKQTSFTITNHIFELFGLCENCS